MLTPTAVKRVGRHSFLIDCRTSQAVHHTRFERMRKCYLATSATGESPVMTKALLLGRAEWIHDCIDLVETTSMSVNIPTGLLAVLSPASTMDELSSSAASRRLWSQALQRKKVGGRPHRRDPVVTLPVLARRSSGQHTDASRTSLHAFLAAQLDANDRESYSRSQLRAMASSKLQPSSNNNLASTSSRTHSTERLAPLDPASFEKTRAPQRRPLPGPLQAAINEVLAVRNHQELLSDREDRCGDNNNESEESLVVPTAKRSSPTKKQLYGRRPEWRRYIRRIMMTNGIRGSTLARYRRLVGIVARRSLAQSLSGAAERVLRYRLESRNATTIQRMVLRFLVRRRQANTQRRHRAAARIQSVWKKVLEVERQRKLAEEARQATMERLTRACAARVVQRGYRNYRRSCRLREDERRQQHHASVLQRARLKLLHRYQTWRHNSTKDNLRYAEAVASIPQVNSEQMVSSDVNSSGKRDELRPQGVHCGNAEVVGSSVISNEMACNGDRRMLEDTPHHEQELEYRQEPAVSISPALGDGRVDYEIRFECGALFPHDHPPEKVEKEALPVAASLLEDNQQEHPDAPGDQETPPSSTQVCKRTTQDNTLSNFLKAEHEDDDNCGGNNADTEEEASVSLSPPAKLPQMLVDAVEDPSAAEATALAVAVAMRTRKTAAGKIARSLAPKVEARHKLKTSAVVRIQCLMRSHLARQCMARVRLGALLALREQLRTSWKRQAFKPQAASLDNREQGPENDDEDEELDLKAVGYQPSLPGASETYLHLLPTRNGQIPPGVPLLQASAGAPVLSLWKWSWPGEQWLHTSQ